MKRPLKFKELSDSAKIIASEEVAEIELARKDSWDIESESVTQALICKLDEYGYDGKNEIYEWSTYPKADITLHIDDLNDVFLEKCLNDDDIKLYKQLMELSDSTEELFCSYDKYYQLELHFRSFFDERIAIELLMTYGENAEDKAEFAFIELFKDNVPMDQIDRLEELVTPIVENLCNSIESTIGEKLENIETELKEIITRSFDYFESPSCYYDFLENDGYVSECYRFNEYGNIVEIEDEIRLEFHDEYEEYRTNNNQ